ncbi:MAG: hypothetical protein O8C63_00575 [Candidatus Methanoperedens sp.]|nr:hypothetical protein [Candidatus Methanoperedens sp.]
MTTKKILVFSLILMLTASPVFAGGVTLNRWVLNVTLNDTGSVDEVIQTEIENGGSTPLEGFSFVVPASRVTITNDQIISIPATGQEVSQQTVPDGVKIIIKFNKPLEAGKKWDGRISLTAENWAVKEGSDYSISIPVKAPQAIVAGKDTEISVSQDSEIRSQVFLPKGVTATSVDVKSSAPKPYKKLLQFEHVVLTWFQLNNGDVISIKGSFSDILMKIVDNDAKYRELTARVKTAKEQGLDVSEAQTHLNNAEDYNNNQALQSFWKNDTAVALQYAGYATDELKLAENSLSSPGKTTLPAETAQGAQSQKSPGFEIAGLILVLLISRVAKRKK